MKIAFTLLCFCLIALAEMALAHYHASSINSSHFSVIEASIDKNVMYVIVTAGVLGVIKLKKDAN